MGVGRNRETQRRERDQEKKRERKERRQRELEERQRVKEGDRRRGDGRDGAGRGNRESREGPIGTRAAVPLTILPIRPPPSGLYALGLRSRHTREGLDRSLRAAQSRRLPARGGGRRTRWGGIKGNAEAQHSTKRKLRRGAGIGRKALTVCGRTGSLPLLADRRLAKETLWASV